jgi:hypothetical protein
MKLGIVLGVWLVALAARVTVFSSGGLGAWLCVIAFWVASAILLALSLRRLLRPAGQKWVRYLLAAVGLIAFAYGVIGPSGVISELSTVVWLACAVGLLGIYAWAAVRRGRHLASHRHQHA